ncbi:RT0821/Lpp0805 family surface protein [Methylobacterium durans]|uniref:RT0821/Lpp0805 family surface protein n=1 Tax=Methylobacterium durans TaxID=2202825 RepID=UPI002AFE598B|nr:RT0821/Lpp0805 family surface protein [Methylobacterium durans]MEA1834999.1 RT0821/Lpp0805 family surface protein [Methylobacterium durans]
MRRRDCKASFPAAPGRNACRAGAAAASVAGLILTLCGCGQPLITFQSETTPKADAAVLPEPTVTGSISKRPASFGADLGEEDWRRARAALGVALDPQGNGRPVKWDNPETSLRGSVNPTGLPYVSNDEICRDFLATVITPETSRFVRGTGCKLSGGSWELKRLRTSRAG